MGEKSQREFVKKLLATKKLNATVAYKKVYGIKKDNVAAVCASQLLRNPKVQKYLSEEQKALAQRASPDITPERIIEELSKIAFANYSDFIDIVDEVKKNVKGQKIRVKDLVGLSDDQKSAIRKVKYSGKGIEIELYDKVEALELIGKHIGMFKDEIKLEGLADSDWFKGEDKSKEEDSSDAK